MSENKDVFPDMNRLVAPRLTAVAEFLGRVLRCGEPENTGAAPALDRALYDQNPMRPIYESLDDGCTQGSLFDSLFYPEEPK